MTYFSHTSAAERYAVGRPYFHPIVIDKLSAKLGLDAPVTRALDVAGGTGQSTRALRQIAQTVVMADISHAMLAQTKPDDHIYPTLAAAEALPFCDSAFELMTVALAFHWLDRTRFLPEAHRLLRPGGHLVIYNNGFRGHMIDNLAFEPWYLESYLERYPVPPRHAWSLDEATANDYHFDIVETESYDNTVTFTPEGLARYLTTQSCVIAQVEQGAEDIEDALAWLESQLTPFFDDKIGTFQFGGTITLLRR